MIIRAWVAGEGTKLSNRHTTKMLIIASRSAILLAIVITIATAAPTAAPTDFLSDALYSLTADYEDLKLVKIEAPYRSAGEVNGAQTSPCYWRLDASVIGTTTIDTVMVDAFTEDCANDPRDMFTGTFPCVYRRSTNTTTCAGALPARAAGDIWLKVPLTFYTPTPWSGNFPAQSTTFESATPWTKTLDCSAVVELTVARAAQETGVYASSGTVTCQHSTASFYIALSTPEVGAFQMSLSAVGGGGSGAVVTNDVSWTAGFVRDSGKFAINVTGKVIEFTRTQLSANKLKIAEKMRAITAYTSDASGEPRLCAAATLTGACTAMAAAAADREMLGTLGAVTGYTTLYWRPLWFDTKTVTGDGYILGTGGLIRTTYSANVTNPTDSRWIELPMGTAKCADNTYTLEMCDKLKDISGQLPEVGDYRYIPNPTHYKF